MGKEIERKYLVDVEKWGGKGTPVEIKQAYLSIENGKIIRIRTSGKKAYLTIKGNLMGITRDEFEYPVPYADALQLMNFSVSFPVEKTRYIFPSGEIKWEIDVFHGLNDGLIIAEVELTSEDQEFEKPDWILEEVSHDERYFNFNLSLRPFQKW
ncbi:MAG: CYTH domain-containing protein [Prolixibacteraceae bacterium]|nr:CYTH domain-containing protein [Prolixibacteraceae bacterium]